MKPPLMAFPAASVISVPEAFKSSFKVPRPATVFTVTLIALPLVDDTDAILPVASPVVVNSKSPISTPFTLSLKVTLYVTVAPLVISVDGFSRVMDVTTGGMIGLKLIALENVLSSSSSSITLTFTVYSVPSTKVVPLLS